MNTMSINRFTNDLGSCLKEFWLSYINVDNRATRSEYWWSYLFYGIIGTFLFSMLSLEGLWFLITIVPFITLTIRRLHDSNRSAWNLLWVFLPIVGTIILLVMMIMEGTRGSNQYGKARI